MTTAPEICHGWIRRMLLVPVDLGTPLYFAEEGILTWVAETREDILTDYKAKLLEHRLRQNEKKKKPYLDFIQGTYSKVCPSR